MPADQAVRDIDELGESDESDGTEIGAHLFCDAEISRMRHTT